MSPRLPARRPDIPIPHRSAAYSQKHVEEEQETYEDPDANTSSTPSKPTSYIYVHVLTKSLGSPVLACIIT
ncbi:hypothetical protein ACF0H5_009324 [Mactra antiquata]